MSCIIPNSPRQGFFHAILEITVEVHADEIIKGTNKKAGPRLYNPGPKSFVTKYQIL